MNLVRKYISTIGLDIGTSMIKAVKMTHKGKKFSLDRFATEPLDEGVIQSGEIRNPSALAQAVRRAVASLQANMKDVIVALPNFSILSEVLTMDLTPDKQLHEAVMVEANRISPFDMSEVEIDYSVLERNESTKRMRVLMVAAKNDIILSYIDFLSEAGLRPVLIDVDLFALTNIFQLNYDAAGYKSCILLNIGSESTVAAFLQDGVYHSSRDISAAGWTFQKELKLIQGMTDDQAHDILHNRIDPELEPQPIADAINVAGKEFANAVGVAGSYFQASDNVEKLDAIVLTGGYALIPGLVNILELRTGAEVFVLDPFKHIEYGDELMEGRDPRHVGSMLSVAMGLGTRTP